MSQVLLRVALPQALQKRITNSKPDDSGWLISLTSVPTCGQIQSVARYGIRTVPPGKDAYSVRERRRFDGRCAEDYGPGYEYALTDPLALLIGAM
jgi:hypothetical protein